MQQKGSGRRISPSVCRRSMSSGTRSSQVRARFRQISNASRPSSTRRALQRIEAAIAAAEQRDQRDMAAFHVESGRRLFQAERDAEAIAELRRAIYLSPYEREAHLLLGRLYLRGGQIADAIDELKISIWSDDRTDARAGARRSVYSVQELRRRTKRTSDGADPRAFECERATSARNAPGSVNLLQRLPATTCGTQSIACYNRRATTGLTKLWSANHIEPPIFETRAATTERPTSFWKDITSKWQPTTAFTKSN